MKESPTLDKIAIYTKMCLIELYSELNPAQQEFFNLLYGGVDIIPKKNIEWAIRQCENTIAKNKSLTA